MAIITGTSGDDTLIVNSDTASVQADTGTDTAVFSGNYADYTFSQSDSFVPLMTHNTTGQVVSLFGVEQLQFDDGLFGLSTTNDGEFRVNTYTLYEQSRPSITTLSDGDFIIVWESTPFLYDGGQDGSAGGIFAQMYNSDGATQGLEFQVNSHISHNQFSPSISTLNDSRFVISWVSEGGQDGDSDGIFAQIYNANGNVAGNEFQVNTYTVEDQGSPIIIGLFNGGFVIAWNSDAGQDGSGDGVFAQMYDSDGIAQGVEFQVNTYTQDWQYDQSITALNDGGFIIAWSSYGQDGSNNGIYAQRYDADGNTSGSEFQVNTPLH